jgi:two-component system KDP operon response regulator KdpE
VLVLTARADEVDTVVGLDAGADDYVTKPFSPAELVARLRAVLRRVPQGADQPRIEADGLVVDLAAHEVSRNGEQVHLTPTEFDILRALVLNRGRLMTHRTLLTEVWGPGYAEDTQVLRVHVANLRRKLGDKRYIRTDPGIGYRFDA